MKLRRFLSTLPSNTFDISPALSEADNLGFEERRRNSGVSYLRDLAELFKNLFLSAFLDGKTVERGAVFTGIILDHRLFPQGLDRFVDQSRVSLFVDLATDDLGG